MKSLRLAALHKINEPGLENDRYNDRKDEDKKEDQDQGVFEEEVAGAGNDTENLYDDDFRQN